MTRRLVEVSVTTGIPFADLAGLDPVVFSTYVDVLRKSKT
jgi:hypothetical protein